MDETLENPEYINIDRTVWARDDSVTATSKFSFIDRPMPIRALDAEAVDEKIGPILEQLEQQEETIAVLMKALAEQIEKVDQIEEQLEAQATEISRHEVELRTINSHSPSNILTRSAGQPQHTHDFPSQNKILEQSSQIQNRRGLTGLFGTSAK